jgi:A/G-specific adenine glycosylase
MGKKISKIQYSDSFFTQSLMRWHLKENNRVMPWKGIRDPYRIWLSEVILQQTRVEQGLVYYERFIDNFPTIKVLAEADDTKVFKCWEGLGYYSRCRNLLHTARFIQHHFNGVFPDRFEDILALKGVGPYTAAAIASFAYQLPHAVVDGNVIRVLSRFFAYAEQPTTSPAKKWFSEKANALLEKKRPDLYNQAIMDLGATICKPQHPLCDQCPLQPECRAFREHRVSELPFKIAKGPKKDRFFLYLVARHHSSVFLRKREEGDVWANLHEFVLVDEVQSPEQVVQWLQSDKPQKLFNQPFHISEVSAVYKQVLSHQRIQTQFVHILLPKSLKLSGYEMMDSQSMHQLAFPRSLVRFLKENAHWFEG